MPESLPLAFFSMPGGLEWIVIGLVALLVFGKRLPGVARSLGQALHEFKSGLSGSAGEGEKKDAAADAQKNNEKVEEKKPDGEA